MSAAVACLKGGKVKLEDADDTIAQEESHTTDDSCERAAKRRRKKIITDSEDEDDDMGTTAKLVPKTEDAGKSTFTPLHPPPLPLNEKLSAMQDISDEMSTDRPRQLGRLRRSPKDTFKIKTEPRGDAEDDSAANKAKVGKTDNKRKPSDASDSMTDVKTITKSSKTSAKLRSASSGSDFSSNSTDEDSSDASDSSDGESSAASYASSVSRGPRAPRSKPSKHTSPPKPSSSAVKSNLDSCGSRPMCVVRGNGQTHSKEPKWVQITSHKLRARKIARNEVAPINDALVGSSSLGASPVSVGSPTTAEAAQAQDEKNDDAVMASLYRTNGIDNGKDHPSKIAESQSLAGVDPPLRDFNIALPPSIEQCLSNPQLEAVCYASYRFEQTVGGAKGGYFLGEGTGCGKGRIIAACILNMWNKGYRRHVWLSTSQDLALDCRRDLADIGADHIPVYSLGDLPAKADVTAPKNNQLPKSWAGFSGEGVLFVSYALIAKAKSNRAQQVADWLTAPVSPAFKHRRELKGGDTYNYYVPRKLLPGGLLVYDEAHKAKTLTKNGIGSSETAKQMQILSQSVPECPVLYSSATGASTVAGLRYMTRLGLWGEGTSFANFDALGDTLEKGGIVALESLAMDLKSEGLYSSHTLSYDGVSIETVTVAPPPSLVKNYHDALAIWRDLYSLLTDQQKKQDTTGAKAKTGSQFWLATQRFSKAILVSGKVEETVRRAKAAEAAGNSVVISLWSTGEARTAEKMEEMNVEIGDELDEFASSPTMVLEHIIKSICEGDPETGNKFLERVAKLHLPQTPLDALFDGLGGHRKVSELTGRKIQFETINGKVVSRKRVSKDGESVNVEECKAFQRGDKPFAIISAAASAGISLHADPNVPDAAPGFKPRPRLMIVVELSWSAESSVQQFGRIHRSSQIHLPNYQLLVSTSACEQRFVAAAARRLKQLGALTRGDRRAAFNVKQKTKADEALLDDDNEDEQWRNLMEGRDLLDCDLQSKYGTCAVMAMYGEILKHAKASGIDHHLSLKKNEPLPYEGILKVQGCGTDVEKVKAWCVRAYERLEQVGLIAPLCVGGGGKGRGSEQFKMTTFLNRIAIIDPELQDLIFNSFLMIHDRIIENAKHRGAFDEGVMTLQKVMSCSFSRIDLMSTSKVWTNTSTQCSTFAHTIEADRGIPWETAMQMYIELHNRQEANPGRCKFEGFYESSLQNALPGRRSFMLVICKQPESISRHFPNAAYQNGYHIIKANLGDQGPMPRDRITTTVRGKEKVHVTKESFRVIEKAWRDTYASTEHTCTHQFFYDKCKTAHCRNGVRIQTHDILSGNLIHLSNFLENVLQRDAKTIQKDRDEEQEITGADSDDIAADGTIRAAVGSNTYQAETHQYMRRQQQNNEVKRHLKLLRVKPSGSSRQTVGALLPPGSLQHVKDDLEALQLVAEEGQARAKDKRRVAPPPPPPPPVPATVNNDENMKGSNDAKAAVPSTESTSTGSSETKNSTPEVAEASKATAVAEASKPTAVAEASKPPAAPVTHDADGNLLDYVEDDNQYNVDFWEILKHVLPTSKENAMTVRSVLLNLLKADLPTNLAENLERVKRKFHFKAGKELSQQARFSRYEASIGNFLRKCVDYLGYPLSSTGRPLRIGDTEKWYYNPNGTAHPARPPPSTAHRHAHSRHRHHSSKKRKRQHLHRI